MKQNTLNEGKPYEETMKAQPHFACQEQLVPGSNYAEKFEFLRSVGFQGIEIWSQNLTPNLDELSSLSLSTGVRVSSGCQGFDGGVINIDEEGRRNAISSTIEALQALALVGAAGFVMPSGFALGSKVLPPFKPPRSEEEDTRALLGALEEILPVAAECQVAVFLEPINRYETHFMNLLAEARAIAERVDHPWLKVMADTFHMNIEESNLAESLHLAGPSLRHVHLADNNRKLPGQGDLDFVRLFTPLLNNSYNGWLAIECDRPADSAAELPVALHYLQECWATAAGRLKAD